MQQFFGHPESPLFGVYHPPRGKRAGDGRAVLICPGIGQEYIRTHWCLRLVANQIARGGAHVLRLDYHGMGDSSGRIEQVDSLRVWQNNIHEAVEQLKQISGAHTVMLLGQRFGGTLAGEVARQRPDVNSVVLWEPVINGLNYLNQLRTMHAEMLDLWVCKMQTQNDELAEEILGSLFSRSLLNEIEDLRLAVGDIPQPQLIVTCRETDSDLNCPEPSLQKTILDDRESSLNDRCELESDLLNEIEELRLSEGDTPQPQLIVNCREADSDLNHPEPSLQKIILDDREPSWNDLRELESAYLRSEISRRIVNLVREMFDRLERFDALKSAFQLGHAEVGQ